MTAPIEINGQPADAFKLPPASHGESITVCAWCQPVDITRSLTAIGYHVSHGICQQCRSKDVNP